MIFDWLMADSNDGDVVQVLSQTHWLTQLLDLECRDGHVIRLKGSYSGQSCNSSCSTLSELDNCDSGVGSVDCDNNDADTLAEPIDVILGSGETFNWQLHLQTPDIITTNL